MPKDPNRFYVYVLFDWCGIPRYVGMGCDDRWTDHEHQVDEHNPMKQAFIDRTLAKLGQIPKIKLHEDLTRPEANQIERLFIRVIGRTSREGPLTNLTDGGDGGDFGEAISRAKANWSPEMREQVAKRQREAMIKWWKSLSPEEQDKRRDRLRAAGKARRELEAKDPTVKANRANAIKVGHQQRTPEQKAAAIEKQRKSNPPERQSETTKKWHANMTAEARQARGRSISRTLTGRPFSGNRTQISEAQLSLWKDPTYRAMQIKHRTENPSGRGRIWITDGVNNRRIFPSDLIPKNWRRGRTYPCRE